MTVTPALATVATSALAPVGVMAPAFAATTAPSHSVLPSGEVIVVRPTTSEDAAELAAGFEALSVRTRYQRFFTAMPTLSAAQLAYLTQIDHHDHEALVAVDAAAGRIIGVARFVRSRVDPESAEIAVTIGDAWQGRGVGSQLMRRLVERAREVGVTRFTAEILSDNRAMLGLIHKAGRVAVVRAGATTLATIAIDGR